MVKSCFFIQSDKLGLLIGAFRPCIFNVITVMVHLCIVFYVPICPLFPFSSFPAFFWNFFMISLYLLFRITSCNCFGILMVAVALIICILTY